MLTLAHGALAQTSSDLLLAQNWLTKRVTDQNAVQLDADGVISFTLDPKIPRLNDGFRQELTSRVFLKNYKTVEFEIWTKIPKPVSEGHPTSLVLLQWHETMSVRTGHLRPPLAHRLRNNQLHITAWSDDIVRVYGTGGAGRTLAVLDFKPEVWHQFRYRIHFHPDRGTVQAQHRECFEFERCDSPWTQIINYKEGIGYKEAYNYYLKFGTYTTRPFSEAFAVSHFILPNWVVVK
jgi:hypothetical protein